MLIYLKHRLLLYSTKITGLVAFLFLLLTFISCSGSGDKKKFEHAGGTFKFAISNEPQTLLPRNVSDVYSGYLLNQVYQGLVTFNPTTLEVEPCLAKSWDISEDGKTIQFELRDDVYFHQHKDFKELIKLTPEDVVYSIELACTPNKNKESVAYSTIYKGLIKGADQFYNQEADHIEGIKVKGNAIIFELVERDINFINKMAQVLAVVVSKKIVEAGLETDLIGTGPFQFMGYREIDGLTNIILTRNENYYEQDEAGNQLPYLDSLIIKVESRSLRQLEMFENEEIMLIDGLPPSRISTMLGEGKIEDFNSTPPKLLLIRKPLLGTQFYHFNLLQEEFKDVRVRKAFNYAINKGAIVNNILNNQAYSKGDGGIVPPAAFNGYDSKMVKKSAYSYHPEKAKQLLAEAGYPNGEGFPNVNIKFNLGTIHSAVADDVAKQLKKVLNINVNLDGMPFQNKIKDQENANGQIFRSSWFADYYSPESFLMNGYGKTVPEDPSQPSLTNHSRYSNPAFDEAFEKGRSATDIVERYKHFAEAESILMEDSPFIILWYEETIKIAYSKVRNLQLNEMNHYVFRDVYIKEWTKKEWEEHSKK
ncbi:ABC transporter substrate-binding protein [Brumimicrobium sp.]|uniref:ABC transporter substrate-binding protein n=1 Tax=Brumimicrobium sp. TaxID=2029867 RepID=UPI003A8FF12C